MYEEYMKRKAKQIKQLKLYQQHLRRIENQKLQTDSPVSIENTPACRHEAKESNIEKEDNSIEQSNLKLSPQSSASKGKTVGALSELSNTKTQNREKIFLTDMDVS